MLEYNPIDDLNGEQAREYNRAQVLSNCLTQQASVYPLFPPFNAEAKLFFNNHKKLVELVPDKTSDGTTITKSKEGLKTEIAVKANIICARTAAYALSINDEKLQAAVYHSTSSIHELKDAGVLAFITRLTGIVSPLLTNPDFIPYAITADMLDEVTEKANTFNNSIGQATYADTRETYYSASINEVLKAIRSNITRFNLLLNYFETDHPEFVTQYRKAIVIDYSNVRHSGIEGIITNPLTGAIIEGTTIIGEGKNKQAITDSKGYFKLIRLRVGMMKITVAAPGYETQVIEFHIRRGRIIEFNVNLQAKVLNITATA